MHQWAISSACRDAPAKPARRPQLAKDGLYLHHIWKPLLHEVAAGALGMGSKPVQSHVKLYCWASRP